MIINHNIPVLAGLNVINRASKEQSKNSARLSSGIKLNNAGDDPSGFAVSRKIRTQIVGLERASQNCNDAISLIQTTDGTLSETANIVQRMRELAVQAANDTNTEEDRTKIQSEIDSLIQELDEFADRSQFNAKNLFNGDNPIFTIHTGANTNVNFNINMTTIDAMSIGYTDGDHLSFDYTLSDNSTKTAKVRSLASLSSNYSHYYSKGLQEAYDRLSAAQTEFENAASSYNQVLESNGGNKGNSDVLAAHKVMIDRMQVLKDCEEMASLISKEASYGTYSSVSNSNAAAANALPAAEKAFSDAMKNLEEKQQAYYEDPTNASALSQLNAAKNNLNTAYNDLRASQSDYFTTFTEGKGAYLSQEGAEAVLNICSNAINTISSFRSRLGSYQVRLEYTISATDDASMNSKEAFSRIADTDAAEEIIEYTKNNLLNQVGISMMAQANHRPDQLISLLQ
ncbi:MAG: flagellin [Firmicutes bacterium]|nr:flagellin [Bacillota bacterium]